MTRAAQDNAPDGASTAGFAVSHRRLEDGTIVVAAEGELDLASAPGLKWELTDVIGAGAKRVVLDMSRVRFIDSTALGVLVGVRRSLAPGRRLAIAGAEPDVHAVFELTGLDATFDMFATLDEGLRWAREGSAAAG